MSGEPKKAKEKENEKEKEKENEKENEKEKESEKKKKENGMNRKNGEKKENEGLSAGKPPVCVFSPPTAQELRDYCAREGFTLDTGQFLDYYESNGWMVGRNRMRSWQAAVRNWVRKEKASAGKAESGQPWGTIGTVL